MLKYEKRLHFDKYYSKMQSNGSLPKIIFLLWGVAGYAFLYFLVKYIFNYIPDFRPWNSFEVWFSIGTMKFIKSDLAYFICGLIVTCYGSIRLSSITVHNHSAKNQKSDIPAKLLITGYYSKVRHPMYGTFIILQAGFMLSLRSFIGMMVILIITAFQYINAKFEEKNDLIPLFGDEYRQYIKKVNRTLLTRAESIIFILVFIGSLIGYIF
ncbi:MAG TPA: methyltransferase [Petrotogaceae bacterium]|nr:methyltransferase [Petrotogaceae bacterium]HQH33958.1 methyltransferase [Petrotogaceae bacterium]